MENLPATVVAHGHTAGAPEAKALAAWEAAASESKSLGNFFGPGAPLIQFNRFLTLAEHAPVRIEDSRTMDFGCGARRPFSISALLYLFGAREVVALDVVSYDESQASGIAKNLWLLLMVVFAGESGLENSRLYSRKLIESRICHFDMQALRAGCLRDGLPDGIQHMVGDYIELADQIGSIDLVLSNSVFEHVPFLRETIGLLRTHMATTGLVYSDIDYRDHRQYVSGLSPWEYLIDDSDVSLGYINKVRNSSMIRLLEESHFNVVRSICVRNDLPRTVRAALHPNYKNLSEDDLVVLQNSVLLRAT